MTDAISQIQAVYEPLEDRILLNITTNNLHVYAVWITRRYIKLLIPALQGKHPRTGAQLLSDQQWALMHIAETDVDLRSPIFDEQPIPEEADFPLGEEPVLLAKIGFTDMDTDQPTIELNPDSGNGLALPYDAFVIKLLLKVLKQALPRANWQLEVEQSLGLPEEHQLH